MQKIFSKNKEIYITWKKQLNGKPIQTRNFLKLNIDKNTNYYALFYF